MPPSRRFPLPWAVDGNENCYWVQDADGKRLAYIYFSSGNEAISTGNAGKLDRLEALKIARNIAKLPILLLSRSRSEPFNQDSK